MASSEKSNMCVALQILLNYKSQLPKKIQSMIITAEGCIQQYLGYTRIKRLEDVFD